MHGILHNTYVQLLLTRNQREVTIWVKFIRMVIKTITLSAFLTTLTQVRSKQRPYYIFSLHYSFTLLINAKTGMVSVLTLHVHKGLKNVHNNHPGHCDPYIVALSWMVVVMVVFLVVVLLMVVSCLGVLGYVNAPLPFHPRPYSF